MSNRFKGQRKGNTMVTLPLALNGYFNFFIFYGYFTNKEDKYKIRDFWEIGYGL